MKRLLFVLSILLIAGCHHYPPDTDNLQSNALRLIAGVPIQDSINPKHNDKIDWRMFVSDTDVRVTVVYTIGEQYKPHNVRGEIIVFDRPGNVIARKPVVPGKRDYTIMFTARKQAPYYFEFRADSGAAGYLISCTTQPLDPCSKCGPGTTCCLPTGVCCPGNTKCVAGQCVSRNVCTPPCKPDQVCQDGICVSACGHCRRGYVCDIRIKRCIRRRPIRHHHTVIHRERRPKCKAGQVYDQSSGHCITPSPATVTITANILNVKQSASGNTLIVVDRGAIHGVKFNYKARMGGILLRQYSLSRTRSTWKTKRLDPATITAKYKTITIFGN